jgi:carbonic anhydrase
MKELIHLLDNNKKWVQRIINEDPAFFKRLADQQSPAYLWIGCSDSRVPANEIVGLLPGELFVHRNVSNLIIHTDFNCLSVIQYALEVLGISHIIVCGHYGCGGVEAAVQKNKMGLIDNWLRHIQDVMLKHEALLKDIHDPKQRLHKVCELNVIEQAKNVCQTTIVQNAWQNGQKVTVHSWVYSLENGFLRDLGFTVNGLNEIPIAYDAALGRLTLSGV